MKQIVLMLTGLFCLLISCQSSDKNGVATNLKSDPRKYQMEVFQNDENDFKVICLDQYTGDIFIRNDNGTWYNAQTMNDLKKYDFPVYSMKIINGAPKLFQIVLMNAKNGNVYVRSSASSWYDASGIRNFKK